MEMTLAERKEQAKKELAEIKRLEKLEAVKKAKAEKVKTIDRLLLSLHKQPLKCGLPIQTVAHVKKLFDMKCADCKTCFFAEVCQSVLALTSKGQNRTGRTRKENPKIRKDFSKAAEGIFQFSFDELETGKEHSFMIEFQPGDFGSFKKALKKQIKNGKAAEVIGLSVGQFQALQHRASMHKLCC